MTCTVNLQVHIFPSIGISSAIAIAVLSTLNLTSLFRELNEHMQHSPVEENHTSMLIKVIVKCCCKIGLYHLGKEMTRKLSGPNIRKKLGS